MMKKNNKLDTAMWNRLCSLEKPLYVQVRLCLILTLTHGEPFNSKNSKNKK